MFRAVITGAVAGASDRANRIAVIVELVLVAGLAVAMVHLIWAMIAPPAPQALRERLEARAPAFVSAPAPVDTAILETANAFHASARSIASRDGREGGASAAGGDGASGEDVSDAPETGLDLTLTGIRASTTTTPSAVIAVGSDADQRFVPGDTILEGVTLRRVLPDRVILARNGEFERLSLPDARINAGAAILDDGVDQSDVTPRDVFTQSPNRAPRTPARPAASEPTQTGAPNAQGYTVADADALFSVLDLRERRENGRLIGYEAQARGGRTAELRRVGLEPGDVVTAINGVRLNRPENLARLEAVLERARTARITVIRGDETQTLRVRLSEEGGE